MRQYAHTIGAKEGMGNTVNVSVIFATYNRSDIIQKVLDNWKKIDKKTKYSYEIICSDDASSDNTVDIIRAEQELPIIILENEHGGASKARNAALKIAKGEIVIFTGDDIFPCEDFINMHYENYLKYGSKVATLGKLDWHPEIEMNHLMQHITNIGCEQFGFAGLAPYALTDFRHFYTSNISVARSELEALGEYFSLAFNRYGYEDIELGYRLQKNGVYILYDPDILGYHHHVYDDVEKFCNRQLSAGDQMVVFAKLHKNLSQDIGFGIEEYEEAMSDYVKEHGRWYSRNGKHIFEAIKVYKQRTIELEKILKTDISEEEEQHYRKECSAHYRYIFQFYMYYGWASRALRQEKWVAKTKIAEAVVDYLHSGHVQIFWDTGDGMNECESLKWNRVGTHIKKRVAIENAKELRVDPLDDQCILEYIKAKIVDDKGNEQEIHESYVNGTPMPNGGYDFSGNIDPLLVYSDIPQNACAFEVEFKMKLLSQINFENEVVENVRKEMERNLDYSKEVKQPFRLHIYIPENVKAVDRVQLKDGLLQEFTDNNVSISWEKTFRDGYASYYYYGKGDNIKELCEAVKKLRESYMDCVKEGDTELKSFLILNK